jgi:putative protease
MNVFVPIHKISQLHSAMLSHAYAVILSTAFCSVKTQHPLNHDELIALTSEAKQLNMPWYLSVNRMILQSEWDMLKQQLEIIDQLQPEGYIVSDLGVMHFIKKNYPSRKVILHTDTTITHAQDVEILISLGVDLIVLARELTFEEIREIICKFPDQTAITGFGYPSMSTSSRPLLSSYFHHIERNADVDYKRFTLQEEGRTDRYPAMQDIHGFHIFAPGVLEIFEEVRTLETAGLNHVMIDSLFLDDEDVFSAVDVFQKNKDIDSVISELKNKYALFKALYHTPTSTVKVVNP